MNQSGGGGPSSAQGPIAADETGYSPLRMFFVELQRYPEIGALAGFLVVFIFFAIFAERFVTPENLAGILALTAQLGIVAVGATFLMIAGEFDLSVGSVVGVSAMTIVILSNAEALQAAVEGPALKVGLRFEPELVETMAQFLAALIALIFAALIGLMNGLVVIWVRIPSFIVTLGTMMLWRGLLFAITGGFPIRYRGYTPLMYVLNGPLSGEGFRSSAFWLVAVVIFFTIVLTQTRYGNAVFATGGDPDAARALGINIKRVKVVNFIVSATLAGLVGLMLFSRFKSSAPTYGDGMELEAIAASVIGGALLTGGYGSIIGTLLGSLLMGMVAQGLVLAGAPTYWYRAFIGVILIIAVIINTKVRGK